MFDLKKALKEAGLKADFDQKEIGEFDPFCSLGCTDGCWPGCEPGCFWGGVKPEEPEV